MLYNDNDTYVSIVAQINYSWRRSTEACVFWYVFCWLLFRTSVHCYIVQVYTAVLY